MDWSDVLQQVHHAGTTVLAVAAIVLMGALVQRLARRSITRLEAVGQISATMAIRLRLVARWVVALVVLLLVLQVSGVFAQAWAVLSATLAALAVGFVATWSLLSNATTALFVLVYRPFRVGDEVEMVDTDGDLVLKGRVVDLNLLFTTLHDGEGAAVRVPNNLWVQKLTRVRREGAAPDPARDTEAPFFESSD